MWFNKKDSIDLVTCDGCKCVLERKNAKVVRDQRKWHSISYCQKCKPDDDKIDYAGDYYKLVPEHYEKIGGCIPTADVPACPVEKKHCGGRPKGSVNKKKEAYQKKLLYARSYYYRVLKPKAQAEAAARKANQEKNAVL